MSKIGEFFKEKSAVDIGISTRALTLQKQDLAILKAKMLKSMTIFNKKIKCCEMSVCPNHLNS
jgi:hypothetical protein